MRLVALIATFAIAGCAYAGADPTAGPTDAPSGAASDRAGQPTSTPALPTPTSPTTSASPSPSFQYRGAIPLCREMPLLQAPADWYRESPIYVANEMPIDKVKRFAQTLPGYEEIWIDRDKNGWITVMFRSDAVARQAELEARFPDVGVVAVEIDWTVRGLERLQRRIRDALEPRGLFGGSGIWIQKGLVSINLGPLSNERISIVEELFAGERVCLEGFDPSLAPAPGPQPVAGDGWRLLADQDERGESYRTGIAYDQQSYQALWNEARLVGELPPVDFESEVVIWFGAVHGSSCPHLRLDDVVVDEAAGVVHAQIVLLDAWGACTDDAIPHAYVVAVARAKLPQGPFVIQLSADGPPQGARGERTVVKVDLSAPGSVAGPGDITGGPPDPAYVGPGGIYETGYEFLYQQSTLCGLEWLGPLNSVHWRAEAATGDDWMPEEWRSAVEDDKLVLEVVMSEGDPPTLRATANGHTVVYEASAVAAPACR